MISDKYKCIFVQIPKNAGSSMVEFLGNHHFNKISLSQGGSEWDQGYYKIGTARRLNELYTERWQKYFRFAFIRNPWDRAVSAWSWLTITSKIPSMSFGDFLKNYPFKSPGANWHSMPQYIHIYDDKLNLMVDFVGRFEQLNQDFGQICNTLNIKFSTLPHKKKTIRKQYWKYYNDKLIERCANLFDKDIKLFGYQFGR